MRPFGKVIAAGLVVGLTAAGSVSAVGIDPPIPYGIVEIIQRTIGFLYALALLICPIFIIWGGLEIAVSGGSQQKVAEGKRRITYSLVGLMVMFLASAFVKVIQSIVGTD